MHLCFIDFETYWDEHHSLSKMSAIEYALSPKTELQLLSVKVDHYPTDVFVGEDEIKKIGSHKDFWRDKFVIAHNNSGFDAMLAAWRLGIRPAMWGCTLAMARPLYAKTVGLSLAKQVAHHGLGVKDSRALTQTRGKRLADFTRDELDAMIRYNRDGDTEQCAALFHVLRRHYTFEELWHIDCNIRMLVEPGFELDVPMLETALSIERTRKHKSLLDLAHLLRPEGLDWADEPAVAAWVNEQMQSSAKFSAILESRGVEVPMKWSKTSPDKEIPAIAKTDEAMEELLDHDDEVVAAAAAARLSAKSTQLETRIQSFLSTYKAVGKLPVPAHYCGADTTGRDSGWLYNMLNLPRVNPDKPKVSDALRNSVKAPKGRVVLVRDSSGIELRVNHTLWKVQRSMDNWKRKPDYDLYRDTAASMYSITPDEVQKPQRHYAKIIELACGYQQGGKTFRSTARVQGGLRLTLEQANHGVQFWRGRYPEIAGRDGGWARCHDALNYIARGDKVAIDPWGMCTTEKDAVLLPSGRRILYPNLRQEWMDKWETVDGRRVKTKELVWVFDDGRKLAYMYGGKSVEHLCQAMARDIIFGQALAVFKRTGFRPKHKVYDELVYLPTPAQAPDLMEIVGEEMRKPPSWWPELTLWSEGDTAPTYGAAK